MVSRVCFANIRVILRSEIARVGLTPNLSISFPTFYNSPWHQIGKRFCSQISTINTNDESSSEVSVQYIKGLPHVTVPLPSRNEKCRFALKPISHKVGDFVDMLKSEDRGIDRAAVLNADGIRIASTCSIESLMDEPFWLLINDAQYKVIPPSRERISSEDLMKLSEIQALVAQLYEALHVGEHRVQKEQEMVAKLESLTHQIQPLEEHRRALSVQSIRKANLMTWFGLGLMSVQFGILARLTWWEYSWDIMEPVTYFVTYGTVMASYAYFCITKQEYNYPEVKDRQYLLAMYKRARKEGFDIEQYNALKREIYNLEIDLKRLRDPLNPQFKPHLERSYHVPSVETNSSSHLPASPNKMGTAAAAASAALTLTKTVIQTAISKLTKH